MNLLGKSTGSATSEGDLDGIHRLFHSEESLD